MSLLPVIGITMGDAAGIGPEVIAKSLASARLYESCRPVIIGSTPVIAAVAAKSGIDAEVVRLAELNGKITPTAKRFLVVDNGRLDGVPLSPGKLRAEYGAAAVSYMEQATELALAGQIHGVATGPVNKQAIHAASIDFIGQAEAFAHYSHATRTRTMLAIGDFRLFLVTTHVPLREVPDLCTRERVLETIRIAHMTLQQFGIKQPRIAVAGLNPHLGDGGLMGREEIEQIGPAADAARAEGLDVAGPIPLPTVFVSARVGKYDGVISMYHDQAVLALGSLDLVTTSVGLPFIRTSVGHGTAYDIADKYIADPEPMLVSIELSARLAAARLRSLAGS
ncbi:putative D-threonate 4-phosphate dehydrogenase [uncultured Defluviicoccus sp.]|uniref:Putative D-threonate 4-phosphate dehydrogenase n=1 Tax=metagenome TaxID=256318 RepID=A0A380TFQ9_9ZZZZ|nr:putative D-threonate 4-phosphate dehydrogenase [uncultured Defluviicoccus sp.]